MGWNCRAGERSTRRSLNHICSLRRSEGKYLRIISLTHLVRRGVLGEPDVAVDAEDDILHGQLGDGLVGLSDALRQRRHEGLPVLEGAPVLGIVHCQRVLILLSRICPSLTYSLATFDYCSP